jgi:transcriptional regulator with XRE-family HTH domain
VGERRGSSRAVRRFHCWRAPKYNKVCYNLEMIRDALGPQLREARLARGWTQQFAAARLGVTQAYLSMLERGVRDPRPVARNLVRVYGFTADVLPLTEPAAAADLDFAVELAGYGYPGFAHLVKRRARMNPAVFLLTALGKDVLDARVSEALPWLVVKYPAMRFEWLLREACARTLQNRLGFVLALAQDWMPSAVLDPWLANFEDCKLARKDSFCRELNAAERRWLEENSSPEAKRWNVLSTARPSDVRYVR